MNYHTNQHQESRLFPESRSLGSTGEDPAGVASSPEVSVGIPCLNDADTLGGLEKVQRAFTEHEIKGEVIVADNGSRDGSRAIAARMGARVIQVESPGYGNAGDVIGGVRKLIQEYRR